MAWDIEEYRSYYIRNIQIESKTDTKYDEEVFIERIRDILVNEQSMICDIQAIFCPVTSNEGNKFKKMMLSAGSVEEFSNTINLLYCDYNDDIPVTLTKTQVLDKTKLLLGFLENSLKGYFDKAELTSDIYQFSVECRKAINVNKTINKIQLFFVSTNYLSERLPRNLELELFDVLGVKLEVKLFTLGFNEIFKIEGKESKREDLVIRTSDFGVDGIPCIKANINTTNYDAYLAIMPGALLSGIYDKYAQRVLEQNVRSFLNVKGKVNNGIRNTILNESENFFVFNNGISATAKAIVVENTSTGPMIKEFTELQIVNGGQTTASLSTTAIKDKIPLDNIFVQMKLTVSNTQEEDFVQKISIFSNSQNNIKPSDLVSNHSFYNRVFELSSKIFAPTNSVSITLTKWFFERTRGSYEQPMMNMSKSQRNKYQLENPKSQKFTKGDLAKWIHSDELRPYDVSWGPEINLTRFQADLKEKWNKDNSVFNEYYFKTLIAKGILFKKIGEVISNQQWYIENRAHRDKLVPYTFSKLVYDFNQKSLYINYISIWNKQSVPQELLRSIELTSKLVFDTLNDPKRQVANIAEYAKREIFWNELKKRNIEIPNETYEVLITSEVKKEEGRFERQNRREDNIVSGIIEIFNFGANRWEALLETAMKQDLLTYYDQTLIHDAIKYCRKGSGLTDKRSKELINLKAKMEEIGIKV